MNEDYTYKEAFIYQRDLQTKFDYYFLGVILAALSLSIQTYDSTKEYSAFFLIILSWILFLISFLAGFFRQEKINSAYYTATERIKQKKRKELFDNAQSGVVTLQKSMNELWTKEEIQESLENINDILSISDKYIKKYERQSLLAYQIQKWSFFYASYLYILFKIANTVFLPYYIVVFVSVAIIMINIIFVKIYKSQLKKE